MVEMSAAFLAGMVDIEVSVWRGKALALKLLALAYYAPAATLDYSFFQRPLFTTTKRTAFFYNNLLDDRN
ncbi:MAG TPA: hypothetical protein VHA09_03390 [Nitrososphaera sp.]|nr:hypothetical protein [Nitrososphaera sp.]